MYKASSYVEILVYTYHVMKDLCNAFWSMWPHPQSYWQIILQFGGRDISGEEMGAETIKKHMTDAEWQKIYEMSQDRSLYQNLISSLFPTIHGQYTPGYCS